MQGLPRLKKLQKEMDRIRKKIELAEKLEVERVIVDGTELTLEDLGALLKELGNEVARAAIVDARREIEEAEDEAGRIRDGKGPRKPAGPGKRDGDGPDGDGDDNGDDGDGSDDGCCCCGAAAVAVAAAVAGAGGGGGGGGGGSSGPPMSCVYVRSDTSVWAWDRREQAWKRFTNGSGVMKVEFVLGGILVVTKQGAGLFDCGLGIWLTELATPSEELVDGDGEP